MKTEAEVEEEGVEREREHFEDAACWPEDGRRRHEPLDGVAPGSWKSHRNVFS